MSLHTNRSHRGGQQRGFTLVELLVVIAIIAILAAILFPVYSKVRENARRTNCQSNVKNIALGIRQYAQDFDEVLPLVSVNSFGNGAYGWADAVQPYLKVTNIYQCLSEPTQPSANANQNGYIDYFFNANLDTRKEADIVRASNTILVGDGKAGTSGDIGTARYAVDGGALGAAGAPVVADLSSAYAQRHMEGSNYAFADGHMKWFRGNSASRAPQLYDGTTPPNDANFTFAYK